MRRNRYSKILILSLTLMLVWPQQKAEANPAIAIGGLALLALSAGGLVRGQSNYFDRFGHKHKGSHDLVLEALRHDVDEFLRRGDSALRAELRNFAADSGSGEVWAIFGKTVLPGANTYFDLYKRHLDLKLGTNIFDSQDKCEYHLKWKMQIEKIVRPLSIFFCAKIYPIDFGRNR